VARRGGLGKGLGALIPPEASGTPDASLQDLPTSSIVPNPHQPRGRFDEESLSSLADSVRELGVLQPVLVRPRDDGTFELIAGERRWRAARRAGIPTIPAIVRDADDASSLEQALVENLHREDLNPLEEAAAYQQLIEDFRLTHEELAARVGRSRAAITNTLRLFQLPPAVQRMVADGQLAAGHARALLGTPDRAFQEALAKRAIRDTLSVRQVEEAVRDRGELSGGPPSTEGHRPKGGRLRPPGFLELEELLSNHLNTRVKIEMGSRRGRLVVDFATLEDLERIYRAMTEPSTDT